MPINVLLLSETLVGMSEGWGFTQWDMQLIC